MKKILTAFFLSVALMFAGLLCLNVNAAATYAYELVTDVSNLAVGDTIIIVNSDKTIALSTTQNKNNRGQVSTTLDAEGRVLLNTSIQEITLESGTVTDTFAFYVGDGYLYAAGGTSTKNNYLKTDASKSAAGSWNISIESKEESKGVATIKTADSTVKKNWLRYNSTSTIFSCYASGQNDVSIMKKIEVEAATTYSISFNPNGGTFLEGKGTTIENVEVGTETTVTLPTSEDLTTLYKYSVVSSWTDGTNTYAPGTDVTVSDTTTFTANYAAPELITISQALEICDLTDTSYTSLKFTVKGSIEKINYSYTSSNDNISVTINDGVASLYLFKMTGGADLSVGDEIIVTGNLVKYKSTTPELTSGTYTIASKVECANFVLSETKSSLIVTYNESLEPTDVDLRLGGVITSTSYLKGATYGVLVTTGTVELTAGKTSYATVDAFIAANSGFKSVTCTPAAVEEGYQFAWVITDMEGHYDTTLTAVMYMVYDGALYICNSKTTSVIATAKQYIKDAEPLRLTEDQVTVLRKLTA